MVTKTLGKAVRSRRLDLNLTQDQLAERSHLTPKFISRIENGAGDCNPTLLTIKSIADALETSVADLLVEPKTKPKIKRAQRKKPLQDLASYIKHLHPEHALLLLPLIQALTTKSKEKK